jgi:hypothetical protein
MKEHDTGRLRAFLDGELSPEERQAVAAHVDRCDECAAELKLLEQRAAAAAGLLNELEPRGAAPNLQAALMRFERARMQDSDAAGPAAWWANVTRSLEMIKRSAVSPRWRPALVALSAVVVMALLFSIAPVRLAAADFLSLFRVRKFAVIPLDTAQLDKLEQLAKQAEGQFGDPQIVREKGPEQTVSDGAQASSLAGFDVRTPSRLPSGSSLSKFTVQSGPAMHYEVDRATLEAFLQAAGAPTAGLPQTDKLAFDVDVSNVVAQDYSLGAAGRMEFVQAPSPQVNLPEGLDPVALAETGFLFLGMPPEDAHRMATSIDWTSTLVVPIPANAAQAREVTVDGVTGLLLESVNNNRRENALVWEKDGILYFMSGRGDSRSLMDAADSLQ